MRLTRAHRSLAAAFLAATLIACGGSGAKQAAPTSTVPTSTVPPATTTAPSRPFSVTRRDITVEDTSRTTKAVTDRNAEKPTRSLPVMLLVPDGPGPFPLVEYSHGQNGTGPQAETLLRPVAAAGYVVVAPTFPLTSPPKGVIDDYVNQPADVYFVVDSVIAMANDSADPLYGRVDASHLALAGHSLGAMTTIGAVYNSCCAQTRVGAAIVLSGVEAPFGAGSYDARPAVPLLLAHGAMDARIPVDGSERLFASATGPSAYLRYPDGTHTNILGADGAKLLDQAMVAWLDKWLRNDSTGFEALPAAVTASGIATLQTKNL